MILKKKFSSLKSFWLSSSENNYNINSIYNDNKSNNKDDYNNDYIFISGEEINQEIINEIIDEKSEKNENSERREKNEKSEKSEKGDLNENYRKNNENKEMKEEEEEEEIKNSKIVKSLKKGSKKVTKVSPRAQLTNLPKNQNQYKNLEMLSYEKALQICNEISALTIGKKL